MLQENPVNIVEAHLLDRTASTSDFYGQTLRLCLIGFLRPEKKFASFDALISQINADIKLGRELTLNADNLETLKSGRALAMKFFESTVDQSGTENDNLYWKRETHHVSR